MHAMILGAGYSGKAIATNLQAHVSQISGTTRTADKADQLAKNGIKPFIFNGEELSDALRGTFSSVTHLIQSIGPNDTGDPLLRLIGNTPMQSLMPKLEWVSYLSTVGVYGDHGGEWVDEATACRPVSVRSVQRVAAEDEWMAQAKTSGLPLSILRLSGIYGPGRNAFRNLENGTARRLVKKDQVFNRIRVEDIGAACALLFARKADGIFNVTDSEPCPPQDVVTYAAQLMGLEPPPEQDFETAELSAMARSFYGENKRVSNRRIQQMGFEFRYPDYRMSLLQMWDDKVWQGSADG
jgi:nucleoside-diphosphate-sugar epimerase